MISQHMLLSTLCGWSVQCVDVITVYIVLSFTLYDDVDSLLVRCDSIFCELYTLVNFTYSVRQFNKLLLIFGCAELIVP
jgi:hypothetical protein